MVTTLGVLVAGGAGSRLAFGMPKAQVTLAGRTLMRRAIAILAAVCDEIVVSAPAGMALTITERAGPEHATRAVRRADDPPGTNGPLAGMVAGLSSSAFERAIVLGVDMPFIEPAALRAMLERLAGRHAVVPAPGGFPQPLAAAYAATAAPILASRLAAGERSPSRALAALDVLRLDDTALLELPGGPDCFFNLNTLADLVEAERRLAAGKATT